MDNAEEIMHSLEEFSKLKPKDIPRELEDYLGYVAKTGDPVFKWSIIKCLFREKLLNVITDFYESTLSIELPPCPNVDPFNYERMKANLLEKLDSFNGAPFTVQRISELLTNPWKEYNRADKFMRAIEKNILVVSTREPGRYADNEVDTQQDSSFNGIPGPNDSGIESSFTCNDIADPDSSSHNFDANQGSQTTLVTGATSNNVTSVSFKENTGDIGDSACSNELGIIRNDEVSQEIIIEEKDTETVICSTINEQPPETEQSVSALPLGENKATDLSMDTECSLESSGDSNVSSNEVGDESKEANVEVSGTEGIDCLQADENKSSTVTENNGSSGQAEIVSNSQDNSIEGSESSASRVFEESRPTECDTSNSLDSETSNSCDSELEIKQPVDEQLSSDVECNVDSSGVNEAASTSNYSVSETTKTEESAEVSNPSTSTTSCEPSEMDVGECQISHVDQSQS